MDFLVAQVDLMELAVNLAGDCIVGAVFLVFLWVTLPMLAKSANSLVERHDVSLAKLVEECREQRKLFREELILQQQHDQATNESAWRYIKQNSEQAERTEQRLETVIKNQDRVIENQERLLQVMERKYAGGDDQYG